MKEESLLIFGNDCDNNACVNYSHNSWDLYARGYHHAAEILIHHIATNSSASLDILIYPLIFLYRQYIELRLKEIYLINCNILKNPPGELTHNIDDFWKKVRAQLEEIEPDGPKEPLDEVESIIYNFSDIDKGSATFRYPFKKDKQKKWKPSLESNIIHINVRHFMEKMEIVISLLEGISAMVSTYQNYTNE